MNMTNIGPELAQLRKGKLSQTEMAAKLEMDQSTISRLESGVLNPSPEDVRKYLAALDGDPTAMEFAKHWASEWKILDKPAFRHPYRKDLWLADCALAKLRPFTVAPTPPDLLEQAKMYDKGLREAAAFLLDLKHNLSFVGNIAAGKTSAICAMTNLLIESAKSFKQAVVLETGPGWITQCEVQIAYMDPGSDEVGKFGLVIYPHPDDEIFRQASDVCSSLLAMRDGKESESRAPEEVERALRSMSGLVRKTSPGPDGGIEDPLLELAHIYNTSETLTAEFIAQMKLEERTTSDLWFNAHSIQEGLTWLQTEFKRVNNGRNPKVSLPKRIDVFVPIKLLKNSLLDVKDIDTKGVDGSPLRPDLQAHLDDPRTITILCSRFAPDTTMLDLIDHLAATGKTSAISERIVFLVLARQEEALAINNEDGTPVETVEEAYALRKAQIRSKLAKYPGGRDIPIFFYDAAQDKPRAVNDFLQQKLEALRSSQAVRLREFISAIDDLVTRRQEAEVQAAFAKLRERLQQYAAVHDQLPQRTTPVYARLIDAFRGSHARTVWASARRNGDWRNLNSYLYVGIGANTDAKTRSDKAITDLDAILEDLLKDPDCSPIRNHLVVLKSDVAAWRLKFLEKVTTRSQEIFRAVLYPDNPLWNACEGFWPEGTGFRSKVVSKIEAWCLANNHQWIQEAVEGITIKNWRDFFIAPIASLCRPDPAKPAPIAEKPPGSIPAH
jgi:transcriptional regulator with XRE-family HTH domain